ncbi:MAG: hypothetical protein M0R05_02670 [Bacilli bacterium]|nr:hypothetical protein [Bacilli bacterium]MDD4077635.1 hypothetical protein [Bacilli bacterium]MDD4387908.1 hypothetical protein [Bacilli bacterium]
MKCLRCGQEIPNKTVICDNCGFNFEEHKLYEKYLKRSVDPEVPDEHKASLIDNPVLTLIFGALSVLFSFLFITASTITIIYLILLILSVFLTFYLSSKPSKTKLRPLRNIGIGMVYFAVGLVIFKIVYQLLGVLFF